MKKILIVNNNMHIGGVQKALVNLLRNISDKYQITLLLFSKRGELLSEIPDTVRVITPKSPYIYFGLTRNDRMNLLHRIGRAFFASVARIFGRRWAIRSMSMFQNKIKGYDIAISYMHNSGDKSFYGGCNEFVLNHVDAKKKIAFIHCDYSKSGANTKTNAELYKQFDAIATCSDGCRNTFVTLLPELADKTITVRNCNDFDKIRSDAKKAFVGLSTDVVNIVTVARLGKEKSVARAVKAISRLGSVKERIKYYIIGDGVERPLVTELIKKYELENVITLCGELTNPYGYMKAADVLLIPSISEAAPLVVNESACLGTPVLSTKTSSADEMIVHTGFGWVCENTVDGIVSALTDLLAEPNVIIQKKKFLSEYVFNNDVAVLEFEYLIDK